MSEPTLTRRAGAAQNTANTTTTHAASSSNNVLSQTMRGASYLVMLQFFSRMVTFTLNQVLVRYTTPDVLGVASIQLELLIASVLFLSREGFRCALLRTDDTSINGDDSNNDGNDSSRDLTNEKRTFVLERSRMGRTQQLINLSYLPVVIGTAASILCCSYYMWYSVAEADKPPYYDIAVLLYGASSLIELAAEPLFILTQVNMLFRLRVVTEGVGVVVRCLTTLGITLYGSQQASLRPDGVNQLGIMAFAAAQLTYSLLFVGGHVLYFVKQAFQHPNDINTIPLWQLVPRPIMTADKRRYYFNRQLLGLAGTFAKQSILKHLLTEGDKILMSLFCSPYDQGIYAFVVNYGSLVARIVYQPMEETIRVFFAKTFPNDDTLVSISTESSEADATRNAIKYVCQVLVSIIKFHLLCGLVFVCFAPAYTGTLVDILAGSQWSIKTAAPAVLALYCIYVPIMGVNGVTESFVQAVARPMDITAQSRAMMLFSAMYLALGALLMRVFHMGAAALVIANAFNMLLRIVWSLRFAQSRVTQVESALGPVSTTNDQSSAYLSAKHMLPSKLPSLIALLACAVTWWSEQYIGWITLRNKGMHIGIGLGVFLPFAAVTYPL
ncbi:Rft protein-domain-containing protein [Syncephalis fuscata]|nr:Rft protein-domain-containing protein [Syncephalis fuscata]